LSPLTPRGCYDPDNPNHPDVLVTPLGYDPDDPRQLDVRYYSPEEVEQCNPKGPVNPPTPKPVPWEAGLVSCWAIFSIPGLFFIVTDDMGFIASVVLCALILFIGSIWAKLCPSSNIVVRHGITICGGYTLVSVGIGLFIPLRYLFVITIVIAAHAAYRRVTRE
jgi:hypothetical protein